MHNTPMGSNIRKGVIQVFISGSCKILREHGTHVVTYTVHRMFKFWHRYAGTLYVSSLCYLCYGRFCHVNPRF